MGTLFHSLKFIYYTIASIKLTSLRLDYRYSSAMMNEVIVDKLTAVGLGRLSNTDLVIIDHSFNDG
jgi:hypothetical protein